MALEDMLWFVLYKLALEGPSHLEQHPRYRLGHNDTPFLLNAANQGCSSIDEHFGSEPSR